MAPICGIEANKIREIARIYAKANSALIFWGMGVSQHTHGTDNARCLISSFNLRSRWSTRDRATSVTWPEQCSRSI